MKAEATVKTTVTVDLGDFATQDLIDELEYRGHAVDADCASELDTIDLLEQISKRSSEDFAQVPLDRLIKALKQFGIPQNILDELNAWESQPIPTKAKLEKWIAFAQR